VKRWLPECSIDALRSALRLARPELADGLVTLDAPATSSDAAEPGELWRHATALVDGRWVVKFAWSQAAAESLAREGRLFQALSQIAPDLPLPTVAVTEEPLLIIYPFVPGTTLTIDQAATLTPNNRRALARALANVLTTLHAPATLERLRALNFELPHPVPQAGTAALRASFHRIVDAQRAERVARWCEWVDHVLRWAVPPVFLHGDFYGENLVFDSGFSRVQAVLDLEAAGFGEPNFDFRYLPGQAPTVELFLDTIDAYEDRSRGKLHRPRIGAWHVLTVLGDALWRTQAGVELPDGGTPAEWVDQLHERLTTLGLETD
jgi:aminoglycoside phosphotransferase (APT) family kinase protein